jgi:hypothetical protein
MAENCLRPNGPPTLDDGSGFGMRSYCLSGSRTDNALACRPRSGGHNLLRWDRTAAQERELVERVDAFENMTDDELRQYVYGNKELDS